MFEEFTHKIVSSTHEVAACDSMKKRLSAAGIKYKIRYRNQTGRGSRRNGTGMNAAYDYIYNVYVSKKDYEKARYILNKK